ncbi:MAG: alpha/beta fold hydrolase [Candidatus Lokiarchaeota archaeon]|nr:alpha/beta fold hydrolase [Candidatus Lokiarchaeota archaeon]
MIRQITVHMLHLPETLKPAMILVCFMKVHYEERGMENSQVIIFVHGAGGSSATWYYQLKGLQDSFHVVAIDLNGHGRTVDRAEEDTVESYLKDIDTVVDNFERPILAGHSMGGALTQFYAQRFATKLSGIILVGTGAKLRCNPMIFDLLRNNFDGYIEAVGEFMFHENTPLELIEASKREVRKCSPDVISRDFGMCDAFDIMDDVCSIKLPTLIIVGDSDVMTPVKYSQFLADKIPNTTMKIIEEAGHSVMLEQWEQFNDTIIEWIHSTSG